MSFEDPTADELRILAVLVNVCGQYMPGSRLNISHDFMSAGEGAVWLLGRYGLIERDSCGGSWTTKANLLEHLDEINLTNIDDIASRFKGLPDGELLPPQPGERQHKCDVHLGYLRLWLPARAASKYINQPPTFRRPGPDVLDVEARLDLLGTAASIKGEILTIPEIRDFRDQLSKLASGSRKHANLVAYKESLKISISSKQDGSFIGTVTISNPMYKHSTETELSFKDNFHIKHAVSQLDEVLTKFSPDLLN